MGRINNVGWGWEDYSTSTSTAYHHFWRRLAIGKHYVCTITWIKALRLESNHAGQCNRAEGRKQNRDLWARMLVVDVLLMSCIVRENRHFLLQRGKWHMRMAFASLFSSVTKFALLSVSCYISNGAHRASEGWHAKTETKTISKETSMQEKNVQGNCISFRRVCFIHLFREDHVSK